MIIDVSTVEIIEVYYRYVLGQSSSLVEVEVIIDTRLSPDKLVNWPTRFSNTGMYCIFGDYYAWIRVRHRAGQQYFVLKYICT